MPRRLHAVREVALAFLWLGLTAFGGPVAHLGFFREQFVERRRWLDDASYADLVALCQALPGPASSQVGFAIGIMRGGLAGGVAAFAAFTLPSALLLVAFAGSAASFDGPSGLAMVHGLKLVAVAVVAHALVGMARSLAPDLPRAGIAGLGLLLVSTMHGAAGQLAAITAGILLGVIWCRPVPSTSRTELSDGLSDRLSIAALLLAALLLALLPWLAARADSPGLSLFDAFYRAGALVFGGGHVVLPLLEAEVVGRGWIGAEQFMAGYGAAQAIPGPLFSFSAYLGALVPALPHPLVGAGAALIAIFLPGFLLLIGVLPFWSAIRAHPRATAALQGVNAAVVGVLAGAFRGPVWSSGVVSITDLVIAAAGFVLLSVRRWPAWRVVIGTALAALVDAMLRAS